MYTQPSPKQTMHVQNPECPVITLTGTEYTPTEEYIIDRPITIIGNAATLPRLSGKETKRIMRVRVRMDK